MDDQGFLGDDVVEKIELDPLFFDCSDWFNYEPPVLSDSSPVEAFSNPSPDSVPSKICEIESLLMNEDCSNDELPQEENQQFYCDFLADILVKSPVHGSACSEDFVDAPIDKETNIYDESGNSGLEKEKTDGADINEDGYDPNDPIAKKRRRQLRNRDAALRSRERKKMYVRDLEMKSKYLEGECRRLGRLLQCFAAENQALHLSLHNGGSAFGASRAKQESAVLLLESLLLGSLLWFLGIMCLFSLPNLPQSALEAIQREIMEKKDPESEAPRGRGGEIYISSVEESFAKSRRCKASRTRMKLDLHVLKSFGIKAVLQVKSC
ncbi:bZIP transcription factor 60-like [Carica papaya]|uniref:bZIP transcription factor 60-like n=1 Tax=Carica papaya TaxID=3649 RepID=UPI000B8C9B9B|nr:bZIP transcription factor 60-like [Carica papaya]